MISSKWNELHATRLIRGYHIECCLVHCKVNAKLSQKTTDYNSFDGRTVFLRMLSADNSIALTVRMFIGFTSAQLAFHMFLFVLRVECFNSLDCFDLIAHFFIASASKFFIASRSIVYLVTIQRGFGWFPLWFMPFPSDWRFIYIFIGIDKSQQIVHSQMGNYSSANCICCACWPCIVTDFRPICSCTSSMGNDTQNRNTYLFLGSACMFLDRFR